MSFIHTCSGSGADIEYTGSGATSDATPTNIFTRTLADDKVYYLEAKVVGRRQDAADRGSTKLQCCVYREASGNATIQDYTKEDFDVDSDGNWDADFVVSGNDINLQVVGSAGQTINWSAIIIENSVS